jgi:hypothetical protein
MASERRRPACIALGSESSFPGRGFAPYGGFKHALYGTRAALPHMNCREFTEDRF